MQSRNFGDAQSPAENMLRTNSQANDHRVAAKHPVDGGKTPRVHLPHCQFVAALRNSTRRRYRIWRYEKPMRATPRNHAIVVAVENLRLL